MVGLECVVYFLADESLTIYILGYHTIRSLHQKHTELGVGIVGICSILIGRKIANPYVFSVVSVGVTSRSNQPICGIISAGKGTIREHIAVKIIAYGVAIERDQTVVGVILEATVGCRGYVTCCIVVEGLGRHNRVIAELLDSSRSDPAEIIISIAHFVELSSTFSRKTPPQNVGGEKFD